MFCSRLLCSAGGFLACTRPRLNQIDDFSKILARAHSQQQSSSGPGGNANYFDGNFQGGDRFINQGSLRAMQSTFNENMSPEVRDSMTGLLSEIKSNHFDALRNRFGGGDGPRMGVMAFGVGENDKGKKVARAAKYEYNDKGESVSKDFFEQQLEDDDVQLPKETVESYDTDGAMEVEFVEDQKKFEKDK